MFATTTRTALLLRRSRFVGGAPMIARHMFATKSSSSTKFSQLPPEVQRELLRHVKPPPSAAAAASKTAAETNNNKTYRWLLLCTAFVGCAASLPYIATQTIGNLSSRDEALSPSGVRRGAFGNTGSKDAGKDPNWDWENGKYVYPKGFAEHLKMQSPNDTDFGPDIGSMVAEEKKKQSKR